MVNSSASWSIDRLYQEVDNRECRNKGHQLRAGVREKADKVQDDQEGGWMIARYYYYYHCIDK